MASRMVSQTCLRMDGDRLLIAIISTQRRLRSGLDCLRDLYSVESDSGVVKGCAFSLFLSVLWLAAIAGAISWGLQRA